MAEDPQTGPVPPQGRPVIGARLAMMFLAGWRTFLVFSSVPLLVAVAIMVFTVCFVEEDVRISILRILGTLAVAETMIGVSVGAEYLRDCIRARYEQPGEGGRDALASSGREVVLMLEIVMLACGLGLLLWIPAEISRMKNMGIIWPLCWAILGGMALWARLVVLKWLKRRAFIPDRDPCSMPGTPPSGEP